MDKKKNGVIKVLIGVAAGALAAAAAKFGYDKYQEKKLLKLGESNNRSSDDDVYADTFAEDVVDATSDSTDVTE